MKMTLSIAGVPFAVEYRYPQAAMLCRKYLTDAEPAFRIAATEEQLEHYSMAGGMPRQTWEAETWALLAALLPPMLRRGIAYMHAAVIAVDGTAYAFLAASGVGKSTHIALWKQLFGERAEVVNGDKPFLSFEGGRLMAHGSPWCGKEGWGAPVSRPLAALCLLERGERNRIRPATREEVLQRLFFQVIMGNDAEERNLIMAFLDRVVREVPIYYLECNTAPEAARIAYAAMAGDGAGLPSNT